MTQGCDVMELKLACLGSKEGNSLRGQRLSLYILQGVTETADLTIDQKRESMFAFVGDYVNKV